jgi:uncharacterized protein (DUF885 family)
MRMVGLLLSVALSVVQHASIVAQAPAAQDTGTQDAALAAFFAEHDAALLARSPQTKAYRGIRDADYGKLDDNSEAAEERAFRADMAALAEMKRRFQPAALSADSQLSYQLFEKQMERARSAWAFRGHHYVFDQMNGVQSQLPAFLVNIHRVSNRAEAEAYVSRLRGFAAVIDEAIRDSARRAAMGGLQPPRWVYPYVISDARNVITGAPFGAGADAPLYADLKAKVAALQISQPEKDAIVKAGAEALTGTVKPAYDRLIAAMTAQEKTAGTDDGVWRFKGGASFYAERLANYTTTDLSADQIHQLGLDNVARIHGEVQAIMQRVAFKGTLQDFFHFMRTDPRFYASNDQAGRERYLSETEKAKQAVTAKLPQWFGVTPQAPLVVKPVEPFREKSAGKAFYQSPAPDGSRPGTYYVNLFNMADMPLFEADALFYHEGLPGHHLQRAIQTELKDMPAFRRFGGFTAYLEGWGLYSEKLASDMGLYTDPYRDFGRLQLELHRAIRLVVDTGLHHKRWTREQAIKYVEDNSADAPGGIVKAIERYVVFPGQATAYMVGRLKISELRDRAQKQLGAKYDVRQFHDLVLESGPVPLDILEERVDAWIAAARAQPGS